MLTDITKGFPVSRGKEILPAMHDGELRILDTDLATRLGFSNPAMIRKLIGRHGKSLSQIGVVSAVEITSGSKGGRPGTAYYLNKKQAIFITAKSETAEATEITIEIIEKFDAYERGDIPFARPKRTRKPSVTAIFKSRFAIARLIGLDDNQSAIAAGRACEKKCGENPLPDMGLTYLEAPTQQRTMTATQVAQALNLPGNKLGESGNNLMEAAGLQTFHRDKRSKKIWTPTETGMPFARLCDVGKGHSDGAVPTYQWLPSVLEPLRLHLATATKAPPFTKKPEPVS